MFGFRLTPLGGGTADVTGPNSSTDNAIPRFDGTTGKLIQGSGVIIDDTNNISPASNDGGALGTATLSFSDLFLASGAVINFANGNAVLTHSTGIITVSTGDLRITTAGTNTASVVTVGGTQTLTNKTYDTGGTGNAFYLNGTLITGSTGSGNNLVLQSGATLINPNIGNAVGNRLVLGAAGTSLDVGGGTNSLQVQGTDSPTSSGVHMAFSTSASVAANLNFYRSKNASIGSATVVASGDNLGAVTWYGAQQTGTFSTQSTAAQMRAEVDGTVTSGASGDMPGRIVWATTADGSGSLTDRLILDSTGILKPNANDGVALGTATLSFSDLFLASGAVLNFANGNVVMTHSSGILTIGTGTLKITTPTNNSTSVVTTDGTQTLSAKTLSGTTEMADAATQNYIVPTVDGTATGPTTNAFNSGYSSSAVGDLVYLDSSATWQKCDANTLALYNGLLGIALEVKSSGNALKVALPGSIVYATAFPTFTIGAPVYMSETAGAVTGTAPTTTDSATRVIGWGVHADKLYFYPSPDYITHV